MLDKSTDTNSIFNFRETTPSSQIIPAYSYNWPYDYCSIIQLSKIDVGFEVGEKSSKIFDTDEDIS